MFTTPFLRVIFIILAADIYISNLFSKTLDRALRPSVVFSPQQLPLFEMRCVCNAQIKYPGSSHTIICGTECVGGKMLKSQLSPVSML